jgi:hypothetical protein
LWLCLKAYEVGRDDAGAFKTQPYKKELLLLWRIKKTMLPGTYRGVSFVDALYEGQSNLTREYADENHLMHAPSELHVREDGTFQVSFEGANKWGWHPYNCTPRGHPGWHLGDVDPDGHPQRDGQRRRLLRL